MTTLTLTIDQVRALTGPQLVSYWNEQNPDKPVKRFASRQAGIKRVLNLQMQVASAASAPEVEKQVTPKPKKAKPSKRLPDGRMRRVSYPYSGAHKEPAIGSARHMTVVALEDGTTLVELMQLTGWNQRNLMDALRLIHVKLGYGITEDEDGNMKLVTS